MVVYKDCYISIPNIFTPNGDGVNDFFCPSAYLGKGLINFNLNIYNRWGQLIFQTNSLDGRGWDGNFNGVPQGSGTYVYETEGVDYLGKTVFRKGTIALIR